MIIIAAKLCGDSPLPRIKLSLRFGICSRRLQPREAHDTTGEFIAAHDGSAHS